MTIIVAFGLSQLGWPLDRHFAVALTPFTLGAFLGGYFGLWISQAALLNKPALARFAGFLALLCIVTVGLTATLFAIYHRYTFPSPQAPLFSKLWLVRSFYTSLGTVYMFAAVGLRLYLPWGLFALVIAAIGFSRGWLRPSR